MQSIKSVQYLGLEVKRLRKKSLLNQQNVADLAGFSRKAISELESGKESMQMNILMKIISVMGISLHAVSGDE